MTFEGDDNEFLEKAHDLDRGILKGVKSRHYVASACLAIGSVGAGVMNIMPVAIALGAGSLLSLVLSLEKRFIRNEILQKRHKLLQNKELENYIVYLNLKTVMTPGYIISLDGDMFRVSGDLGTWRFKEISISKDIRVGRDLVLNVKNLKLTNKENKQNAEY
jgi:hypothetical protein